MSFLSLWNRVNTLGGYILGSGGGTKRQVILSAGEEKFMLPVTPRTYKVQTEQNNVVVDIIDFGEAQLFGNPKLKRLLFSAFFPHPRHDYPFVVGDKIEPVECVAKIEKWKEAKKPVRVIITESPFNLMMAIKSFDHREQDGYDDADNLVFEGNIYSIERDMAKSSVSITAFDHLYVLAKSKTTRKFDNITPEGITRQVCAELGVLVGDIAETGTAVSFIANAKTGYRIIQGAYTEAAKVTEKKYHPIMNGAKLDVIEKGTLIEGYTADSAVNMEDSVYKESIENLIAETREKVLWRKLNRLLFVRRIQCPRHTYKIFVII